MHCGQLDFEELNLALFFCDSSVFIRCQLIDELPLLLERLVVLKGCHRTLLAIRGHYSRFHRLVSPAFEILLLFHNTRLIRTALGVFLFHIVLFYEKDSLVTSFESFQILQAMICQLLSLIPTPSLADLSLHK